MPRDPSKMERVHQPIWDTLIEGTVGAFVPNATIVGGPFSLFTGQRAGNIAVTNMTTAAMLPGNQTYLLLAMRVWLYFRWCGVGGVGLVLPDFLMYHHAVLSLYWVLEIDQKTYFTAPTWYLNAGGGLHGDVGGGTDVYFTNGVPGADSIMALDRPIPLVRNQPFQVNCTVANVGTVNLGTDIAALTTGEVCIQFILDGLKLRDVL